MSWAAWGRAWGDSWASSWGTDDVELYQTPGGTGPQAVLESAVWALAVPQSSPWVGCESSTAMYDARLTSSRSAGALLESVSATDARLLSSFAAQAKEST